jgi:hypothetical protein
VPILSVDKRPVGGARGAGDVATVPGAITKMLSEKYEAAQRGTDGGTYAAWRMEI